MGADSPKPKYINIYLRANRKYAGALELSRDDKMSQSVVSVVLVVVNFIH